MQTAAACVRTNSKLHSFAVDVFVVVCALVAAFVSGQTPNHREPFSSVVPVARAAFFAITHVGQRQFVAHLHTMHMCKHAYHTTHEKTAHNRTQDKSRT